jgi:two-component system, NarL family, nitrate/nitrite response regulator NarL
VTRVLIADDHPLMLSGIEGMLRGTAYEVVAKVTDGAAALEALVSTRPDILVLDVKMRERGGVDVLRALRTRGDSRPVILLTAYLDDDTLIEAIDLDVDGIIMKEGAETLILTCLEQVRAGKKWIEQHILQRALVLSRSGGKDKGPLAPLTARERTIAQLVSQGLRNREIGNALGLTEGTVKVGLHRIYEKLGIGSRVELAMLAREAAPDPGEQGGGV